MEALRLVLWGVIALGTTITSVASVAAYRVKRQILWQVMQVEDKGWPALCAFCDEPAVTSGEQFEWVCATHAPRCLCGEVAVGKGSTGWACAEHWLTANRLPTE